MGRGCMRASILLPAVLGMHMALLPVLASAEAWSLAQVIQQTLARHPDLSISRLNLRITRTDQERLNGQLDPKLTINLLANDSQDPSNSKFNPVLSSTFQQFKAGFSKPLAAGGTLSMDIDYNRSLLSFQLDPSAFARFDPFYHNQIDLTYRQPLLKGTGRPEYHQELAAALADEAADRLQVRVTARDLSRQAIQLYYDIAADEINLKLAQDAVARAEKLLAYQRYRERFGLIERADRLQAEALLATREMDLRKAEAVLAQDRTALNRLMLRDVDAPLWTLAPEYTEAPLPSLKEAAARAASRRPELQALAARLKAAEARLQEARAQNTAQLDLVGTIGSRTLAGTYGTALRKGFSLADRFASIGVEFSDTIGDHAARAALRKAELEREKVLAEKRQTLELIKDDLAAILTRIRAGRKTYHAAKRHAAAEREKYAAELARYRQGRSDTATIIQFEGDLRAAEIETALRRIALMRDHQQLAWAEGILLDSLRIRFSTGVPKASR